jgi:hypothetical protein
MAFCFLEFYIYLLETSQVMNAIGTLVFVKVVGPLSCCNVTCLDAVYRKVAQSS